MCRIDDESLIGGRRDHDERTLAERLELPAHNAAIEVGDGKSDRAFLDLSADSRKLGLVESAGILNRLAPGFDSGSLEPPLVRSILPLDRSVEAYQTVASGAEGRIVIRP